VPTRTWADLVLPAQAIGRLRELAARIEHRDQVMETWGFDARLSTGKGNAALFAGPPGTGKTLAADLVAERELLALNQEQVDTLLASVSDHGQRG
jgi:DNA polymerase III delta prime subunit